MTQSSYSLPNQSGAAYRLAVNGAFQAIASRNYGAAAPIETYPMMYWADSSAAPTITLKQRNASNSAWLTISVMDGSGVRPYYNGAVVTSVVSRTVGVAANNVLALDENAKIPAVNGSKIKGVVGRASSPPAISASGADPAHDIDIATGWVALDGGNVVQVPALTKRIDATWSVGTNGGGLDTGTVQADTWYAVWVIYRSDTAVTDVMFSTDASGTPSNLPANYDDYRRIRWVLTDGSANLVPSAQVTTNTDRVIFATAIQDLSENFDTTGALATLTVPPHCRPIGTLTFLGSTNNSVSVTSPDYQSPSAIPTTITGNTYRNSVDLSAYTVDSSSQIYIKAIGSGVVFTSSRVNGWTDRRGRDD